jgi:SAM-dependent methyltransferase
MKRPPFYRILLDRINIVKTLRNLRIDLQIQRAFLGGSVKSIDGQKMINDTGSSGYEHVKLIFFDYYSIKENDVIVDVGCGKGRVLNYLLYRGIKNKIIGYEINEAVGNQTKKNLSRFNNVEILSENIFDDFPEHANVFYMAHPFNEAMMIDFKDRILSMRESDPVILYNNPVFKDVFDSENFSMEVIDMPHRQSGYEARVAIINIKK